VAWATTLRDKACEAGDSAACFTLARERYEAETRRAVREAAAGPRLTIQLLHQQQAHDESARKSTQWSASTLWSTTGSAPGPQSLPIAGDVDIALSAIYFLVEGCPQCALELEVVRRLEPGGSIEESTLVIRGFTRTLRSAPIRFSGNGLQRLSLAEDSRHPVGAAVLRGKEVDRFLSAAKTQVGSSALYSSICSPPEDWLPAEAGDGDASESALRRRLLLETERRLRECVHRDPSLLNGLFTITRIEVHGRWQDGQGQSRALPTLVHEYSGETD
jgi:hypothetical protein